MDSYHSLLLTLTILFVQNFANAQQPSAGKTNSAEPIRVLLMVDMEGIHGVADSLLLETGNEWKTYGRRLATEDVNAVAAGAQLAGMDANREVEIYASSVHNYGRNIDLQQLIPYVHVLEPFAANVPFMVGLQAFRRLYEQRRFDAAILLGWYAKAGSAGVFAHTMDGNRIEKIVLNGRPVGDIEILANLCGYFNTPVVLVSGDKAAGEEASEVIMGVRAVVTKERLDNGWIGLRPKGESLAALKLAAKDGVTNRKEVRIIRPSRPARFELYLRPSESAKRLTAPLGVTHNGLVFSWERDSFLEAYSTLWNIYERFFLNP